MVAKFRGSLDGGVEGGEPAEKKVPECKGRESSRKTGADSHAAGTSSKERYVSPSSDGLCWRLGDKRSVTRKSSGGSV